MKREMGVFIAVVILLFCSFSVSADVNINRLSGESVQMGANPISGVPQYSWYHGCSPTSGGMLFGYWDSHASGNWSNLVDGDVSTWNATAQNMVASPEHIADYWGTPDPNPGNHNDNCIADFMHTSRSGEGLGDGGTWSSNTPTGLRDYALWDDPATAINESYNCDSWLDDVSYYSGTFGWDAYKNEIDAGNPMLLDLIEWHGGSDWYGHSVVGYGYQENMFDIRIYDGAWQNITVGGFAIWDTWNTTSSQSSWMDWNSGTVLSVTDTNGVEWWPFLDITSTNGYSYNGTYWDWMVVEGVYFHPGTPVPEPSFIITLLSLSSGMLAIKRFRKK